MPESNRVFALVNIHICESIFNQHQEMHLMGIFSFLLLNASPNAFLGLKCVKNLQRNLYCKKGVDFALMTCCISNWAHLPKYKLKDK